MCFRCIGNARNPLRHLLVACLLAAGVSAHAEPAGPRITEREVRDLAEKATRAANARDVPAITQSLADDARAMLAQRLLMDRQQHEAHTATACGR
jgi:hypothetical protein